MIVARLIQFKKLGGFHFNDSKYGDDDLDAGAINPYQLFLVFNELVDAELSNAPDFNPAHMIDQSHNVTDPIESLMVSAMEIERAYVQAHLVDRDALADHQETNDALMASETLKQRLPHRRRRRSSPWRASRRARRSTRSPPTAPPATARRSATSARRSAAAAADRRGFPSRVQGARRDAALSAPQENPATACGT